MFTEDYVSLETAKLLKEKGFKHWCYKCYGTAVYHKGVPISFDEECELESEGLGDEIEYIEGGCLYDFGCDNTEEETNVWAAPTLWDVMKWLREVHKCFIEIMVGDSDGRIWYDFDVINIGKKDIPIVPIDDVVELETYEQACEAAIKYCLENLI